jgi:hypothetical protein
MLVLLDSDARTRPRSQPTLYRYFGAVRPFIERWSAEHDHIREITTAGSGEPATVNSRTSGSPTVFRPWVPAEEPSITLNSRRTQYSRNYGQGQGSHALSRRPAGNRQLGNYVAGRHCCRRWSNYDVR